MADRAKGDLMVRAKRVLAVIGIVILAGMYAATLVFALSNNPDSSKWLIASIVCTVVIPVMIWVIQLVYKLLKGDVEEARKKASGEAEQNSGR